MIKMQLFFGIRNIFFTFDRMHDIEIMHMRYALKLTMLAIGAIKKCSGALTVQMNYCSNEYQSILTVCYFFHTLFCPCVSFFPHHSKEIRDAWFRGLWWFAGVLYYLIFTNCLCPFFAEPLSSILFKSDDLFISQACCIWIV